MLRQTTILRLRIAAVALLAALCAGGVLLPTYAEVGSGVSVGRILVGEQPAPDDALPSIERIEAARLCSLDRSRQSSDETRAGFLLLAPGPDEESCWVAGLVRLARPADGRGSVYLVERRTDPAETAAAFAYRLKQAAIAVRAADAGATVAAGPLHTVDASWWESFVDRGPRPYLDLLAADVEALTPVGELRNRLLPGVALWSVDRSAVGGAALMRAATALSRGAARAWVVADGREGAELAAFLRLLPQEAQVTYSPTARKIGGEIDPALELIGEDGLRVILLAAHEPAIPLRIGAPPVEKVERIALPDETIRGVKTRRQEDGSSIVRIGPASTFELLRISASREFETEHLEVDQNRPGLTAAEIVAREREARARQALDLRHFRARARMAYHFTIANLGESVDVVTENDAFGREDGIEYRQTALFVNGAAWKGEPPAFPFVTPERIKEVPLEVSLDESYRYELKGEETLEGRSCYRIAFSPGEEGGDLRGEVWIERDGFNRVRLDLVRLSLAHPITSDTLTQWFRPVDTGSGSFWLPTRMNGQMVFSALGQNAVVERKIDLSEITVNSPTFDEELAAALASDDPMFRDSLAGGLERLVPGEDGSRTAASAATTSNTLLIGGWGASLSDGFGLPFAGVNWFDMDFRGTGMQLDLAWAGPFAALSLTWPQDKRQWESSLFIAVLAVTRKDRYTDLSGRVDEQDLDKLEELVRASFRRQLGPHVTLAISPRLAYAGTKRRSSTAKEYQLPPGSWIPGAELRVDFQRKGYRVGLWADVDHRLDWGPYGLHTAAPTFTDVRDTPVHYGVQFNKNVYSMKQHRIKMELDYRDGHNLDRLSAFDLSGFQSTNIRGFGSSGIRFHRGLTGELSWAASAGTRARIELTLGAGYFSNPDDYGNDWQHGVGTSLGISFPGPKGTLFRLRTKYGIDSSLPIDGSQGSVRLTIFKTFNGWWPRSRKKGKAQAPMDLESPLDDEDNLPIDN